jgi:hypothetical protein
MNRSIALAVAFALLASLPALGDDGPPIDKRLRNETRKQLAAVRFKAQRSIVCAKCKGSGKYAQTVIFGNRNEYKTSRAVQCDGCVDGVVWSRSGASAVAEYYAILAKFPPEHRAKLEDKPGLASWLLTRAKTPRSAAALSKEFGPKAGERPTGKARLLMFDIVDVYRAPDRSFNLLLGRPVTASSDAPYTLLVHHGAMPQKIGRGLRRDYLSTPFLIVAYAEPSESYKKWSPDWRDQLTETRRSGLNMALPVDCLRSSLIDKTLYIVVRPESILTIAAAKPMPPTFKPKIDKSRKLPTVPTGQGPTARR